MNGDKGYAIGVSGGGYGFLWTLNASEATVYVPSNSQEIYFSLSGKTFRWWSTSDSEHQFNSSNSAYNPYVYFALGI